MIYIKTMCYNIYVHFIVTQWSILSLTIFRLCFVIKYVYSSRNDETWRRQPFIVVMTMVDMWLKI